MSSPTLRLLPALFAGSLLAACAADGTSPGAGGPVAQSTQYPATSVRADGETDRDEDGVCEAPTGSRIRSRAPDCSTNGSPIRTYGKEDLRGTGQTDPGRALQQIDPAVGR